MLPREIVKKIRQIEIRTNRAVNNILGGEYHSVFKGHGIEFSDVREYQIGDDIRSIDWNVTARMGHPFIKKFVEERELTVMLLIDASKSQAFGTQKQNKQEIASEIAAMLAFSAVKNNDRVGLLIFTDRVEKYVPPQKGKQHVLRLIREILYFQPQGQNTHIRVALEHLYQTQKHNCVMFLISDFYDDNYEKSLKVLSKKHDVIAVRMQDPREVNLPSKGIVHLEDPESGANLCIDLSKHSTSEKYSDHVSKQNDKILRNLRSIDTILIDTSKSYVDPLVRFFKLREKRYR